MTQKVGPFLTCALTIVFPYALHDMDFVTFQEKMTYGIVNCQGFGQL